MKVFSNLKANLRKKFRVAALTMVGFLVAARVAAAELDIGAPESGVWAKLGQFFQDFVNVLNGPGVMLVTFISLVAAVGLWVIAPKQQGAIAWAMRACVGAIILFNVPMWLTYLKG